MGLFYEVVFLHTSILFDQYLRCKYCICRFSKKSPNLFPSVCSSSTSHPSCDNLTDSCLSLVSGEQNTLQMLQLNFSISFLCIDNLSLSHFHNTSSDKLWKSRRVARLSLVVLFAQDAMEEVVKVKGDVPRWEFHDF